MKAFAALIALLLAAPLAAQEFVDTDRALSDEAFYKLIACAAPPGADCAKTLLFWPENKRAPLRVGFAAKTEALAPWQIRLYRDALDNAVAEINRTGSGIRLEITEPPHDIAVHVLDVAPGAVIEDGPEPLQGHVLPLGKVLVRAHVTDIQEAFVTVSAQTPRRAVASVMLEEVVQALGLLTDVRSPMYRRSVFAEDSNSGTRLRGQDAMVIRRHYPPN